MTYPTSPANREPKGDHNRRLSLGIDPDVFAAEAGISTDELRDYERTGPDGNYNIEVARLIGEALERLEAAPPSTQTVRN